MDVVDRDLAPGRYRVRIELLFDRAPESTGREFRVLTVGAMGVP